MKSILSAALYLLAGLLVGFAFSALSSDDPAESETVMRAAAEPMEHRLERMESNLATVVADNVELHARLERLEVLLEGAVVAPPEQSESQAADQDRSVAGAGGEIAQGDSPRAENRAFGRRFRDRDLRSALTAGGFSVADAERIESRLEALRLEAMQTRYEAMRNGESPNALLQGQQQSMAALRAELGDADYERFLAATGRPVSVGVTSVIASSAAETAGLSPGDEIVAYGGERVFDLRDLNRVLLDGEPGEPVLVDVMRGGQPIQVVIPRGPLGISSGFARRGIR